MQSRRFFLPAIALLAAATPAAAQSLHIDVPISELEARARQDSCDGAAQYNLAVGYMSQRQWVKADSALARATRMEPQLAVAWLARSIVFDRDEGHWRDLHRHGDSAATSEEKLRAGFARRAYLTDPLVDLRILGSVSQFSDYSDYYEARYGSTFRRFEAGVQSGVKGLVEGDYQGAMDGFNLASATWISLGLGRDTMPEWLLFYRGLAAAHSNQLPAAITDFTALVDRNVQAEQKDTTRATPLRTNEYRYVLAALQQRSAMHDQAVRGYRAVAEADLGNFMAHVQLARIYEADHDWESSIRERHAAVNTNPDDHSLLYDLGAAQARAGQFQAAEETLIQARDMQPRYPRTWLALGVVEQQLGKSADARTAFTQFIAIAPSRMAPQVADARNRLAQIQ
ncbi:MAG TPA: hypothetical protein VGI92_14830 [Gemmatimonadales bacterium]|jgi:tetratricopeptide (TPR) repeat protein